MHKATLYFHTIRYLKPSQIINRFRMRLGGKCSIGVKASSFSVDVRVFESPQELDFDPSLIGRFSVNHLMNNHIELLHSGKDFDWDSRWFFEDKSDLWNYNLHYFEYLFPLVKAWKDSGDNNYLNKSVEIVKAWIKNNPIGSRPAWASYTTALRITNWISWYRYAYHDIDKPFQMIFLSSLHAQYNYLAEHLEKDILGNHYFEDLKSVLLAALFFQDDKMIKKAIFEFRKECKEEVLCDGMHFELSPMYHKIVFEGILRVAVALRSVGYKDDKIEAFIQPMLDVAYSFENGLERIPLFNDGGNNVAKSIGSLVSVSGNLGYRPKERTRFESSGFYLFQKNIGGNQWKLLVDAGQPGPKYNPGHAHCDAMSFELFCNGKPVIVNCGTYAYQCEERSFFRSTAAHNTVMIDGNEQSQCWSTFRLAKRSKVSVMKSSDNSIMIEMIDQKGNRINRCIQISESNIRISDDSEKHTITSYIHFAPPIVIEGTGKKRVYEQPYATDYGCQEKVSVVEFSGQDSIEVNISLLGEING